MADPGQPLLRVTDQTMVGKKGVGLEAGHLGSGYAEGQRSLGRAAKFGVGKGVKEFQKMDFAELWKMGSFSPGPAAPLYIRFGVACGSHSWWSCMLPPGGSSELRA